MTTAIEQILGQKEPITAIEATLLEAFQPKQLPASVVAAKSILAKEMPARKAVGPIPTGWSRGFIQYPGAGPRQANKLELEVLRRAFAEEPGAFSDRERQRAEHIIGQAAPRWRKSLGAGGRVSQRILELSTAGLIYKVPGLGKLREEIEAAAPEPTSIYGKVGMEAAGELAGTPGSIALWHGLLKTVGYAGSKVWQAAGRYASPQLSALQEKASRGLSALAGRPHSSWLAEQIAKRGGTEAVRPRELAGLIRQAAGREASVALTKRYAGLVLKRAAAGVVKWGVAGEVRSRAEAWATDMPPGQAAEHVRKTRTWAAIFGGVFEGLAQVDGIRIAVRMKTGLQERLGNQRSLILQQASKADSLASRAQAARAAALAQVKAGQDVLRNNAAAAHFQDAQRAAVEAAKKLRWRYHYLSEIEGKTLSLIDEHVAGLKPSAKVPAAAEVRPTLARPAPTDEVLKAVVDQSLAAAHIMQVKGAALQGGLMAEAYLEELRALQAGMDLGAKELRGLLQIVQQGMRAAPPAAAPRMPTPRAVVPAEPSPEEGPAAELHVAITRPEGEPARDFVISALPDYPVELKDARAWLKGLVRKWPDFAKNPVFVAEETEPGTIMLVYRDGGMLAVFPEVVGLSGVDLHELRVGDTVTVDLANLEPPKLPAFLRPKRGADLFGTAEGAEQPWLSDGYVAVQMAAPADVPVHVSDGLMESLTAFIDAAVRPAEPKAVIVIVPGEDKPAKFWQIGDALVPERQFVGVDRLSPGAEWRIGPDAAVAFVEGEPKAIISRYAGEDRNGEPRQTVPQLIEDGWQIGARKARRAKPRPPAAAETEWRVQEEVPAGAAPTPVVEPTVTEAPEPTHIAQVPKPSEEGFRPWPEQIPPVGEDFAAELMSAAKQLATPARYKHLQSALGAFRYPGKRGTKAAKPEIRLLDVSRALTASHELGHNIDWLLSDESFPSSISKRFGKTEGERSFRDELAEVSRILRPDLWAAPQGTGAYRYARRHTELMADFVSFYMLDPDQAASLAPQLTEMLEDKLENYPHIEAVIEDLHAHRDEGPDRPAIWEDLRERFEIRQGPPAFLEGDPDAGYAKYVRQLGLSRERQFRSLLYGATRKAVRVRDLAKVHAQKVGIPVEEALADLTVIVERAEKNPRTGKTRAEIEKQLTPAGRKAIKLGRYEFEMMRQTVDRYLRHVGIAEYLKFIEDYFLHAYVTPTYERYQRAVTTWQKRSPQAARRRIPTLTEAAEYGLEPITVDLSEGMRLWAWINYRVTTNVALLRQLPRIANDAGEKIIQKPTDKPEWPTLDHPSIRMVYARPLKGHGVLLWQGRVAVDPGVYRHVRAWFEYPISGMAARSLASFNAIAKAMQLTLFSFFHHIEETFSALGSLGFKTFGLWGAEARRFGITRNSLGVLPPRVGVLRGGKELERVPEFVQDYLEHGGQLGPISGEGITQFQRLLRSLENSLVKFTQAGGARKGALPGRYMATAFRWLYDQSQHFLWDNVQRAKLMVYYKGVQDTLDHGPANLTPDQIKEIWVSYVNDNFGGREWLNGIFANPRFRWKLFQLFKAFDWTWSQIQTGTWPFRYGLGGASPAERRLMRSIGRKHWLRYILSVMLTAEIANYVLNGHGTWDNEYGHGWDIDYTNAWRAMPWNQNWRERGDTTRRYVALGKAGRELVRWFTHPLRNFWYKISPAGNLAITQLTGHETGSDFPMPWAQEDIEFFDQMWERFKGLMKEFQPYSFSGNNVLLAMPARKGMTTWKAIRAYEELFTAEANAVFHQGIRRQISKLHWLIANQGRTERQALMADIAEACVVNQVDAEQCRRAGLSGVRRRHYARFARAVRDGDMKAAESHVRALRALGVTEQGVRQSLEYRNLPPAAAGLFDFPDEPAGRVPRAPRAPR